MPSTNIDSRTNDALDVCDNAMSMVAESVGIQDADIIAQRTMAIEDCAAAMGRGLGSRGRGAVMSLGMAFVTGVVFTALITWIAAQKDLPRGPEVYRMRSQSRLDPPKVRQPRGTDMSELRGKWWGWRNRHRTDGLTFERWQRVIQGENGWSGNTTHNRRGLRQWWDRRLFRRRLREDW